jgi:hypothetical protein
VIVLALMMFNRGLRIYWRRGRLGPLSAEEKAARTASPAAGRAAAPSPQPTARARAESPAPAAANNNGRKQESAWSLAHLGGQIGDGRSLASN